MAKKARNVRAHIKCQLQSDNCIRMQSWTQINKLSCICIIPRRAAIRQRANTTLWLMCGTSPINEQKHSHARATCALVFMCGESGVSGVFGKIAHSFKHFQNFLILCDVSRGRHSFVCTLSRLTHLVYTLIRCRYII